MISKKTNSDDILLFVVFICGLPWVLAGGILFIISGFALFAFLYIFGMILEKKRNKIQGYRLSTWLKVALISLCISYMATAGYYLLPSNGVAAMLRVPLIIPSVLVFPLMISLPIAAYFDKR